MVTPNGELTGQIALVTGGALNIGRAICLDLADAGAAVCVNAKSSKAEAEALVAEIEGQGGRAFAHMADVTDPDAVAAMVEAIVGQYGGLNILINNASYRARTPLAELSLERWRLAQSVTVEGSFLCAQAAVPHITEAGVGTIINIGGAAAYIGVKDRLHAATAKGAISAMTRSLAQEVAGTGITVNCVVPGVIDTVRGASAGKLPPGMDGDSNLLGRKGKPEEVAALVRALCGLAGGYVTGQVIHCNGGMYLGA
ncbi:MAG: SDR family oxidoreductase [Alphaproteobacteria bacterium]|jgi:3-oxoacyl-[acyl-carrier protein] reductase|nr:SDR family oxidoreductase [Alphaproteobacteria bacterium]